MKDIYISCSIQTSQSGVVGFVGGRTNESWGNYLADIHVDNDLIEAIKATDVDRVAVLTDITVEGGVRGKETGSKLLKQILEAFRFHKADVTLVVADLGQANDFDLVEWYQRNGFERVDCCEGAPLMAIASDELVARLREVSGYTPAAAPAVP